METLDKLNEKFKQSDTMELLKWAINKHHPKITLACSFGAEDVVLLDMLAKLNPKIKIFVLDTGRLHQETYEVMDRCQEKYNLKFEIYFPQAEAVEFMVRKHGINLFYKNIELRQKCCHVRKVEPLNRALSGLLAWITGLRREQSVTRKSFQKIEEDKSHNGIIKINPLVDWTEKQVWEYIEKNSVPFNTLHKKGYPSIGCDPCTRAIKPGEDIRAGRWWWESPDKKECGLHK